jgi:hypothetical protein
MKPERKSEFLQLLCTIIGKYPKQEIKQVTVIEEEGEGDSEFWLILCLKPVLNWSF